MTAALTIRPAEATDEAALTGIDRATWGPQVSPAEYQERPFFSSSSPDDVIVACLGDEVIGYVQVRPPTPLPSNAHVLSVDGLAVAPTAQRRGVAARLLEAVDDRAAERGAARVTLRVLAVNSGARALYQRHGYVVEGVLRGEFRLPVGPDGAVVAVDDVFMAKMVRTRDSR
ncbi:MAG TPA: GNAT family N-acetyltransferase [Actinomycetes bacterium]|nr:GNAT family N-acetyltransferase [Actinomycetes bacterium]